MDKKDLYIKDRLQQDKEISEKAEKIFDNFKGGFKLENNEGKKVIKISLNKFIGIAATTVIVLFVGFNLLAYKMEKPNLISTIEALIKKDDEENIDEIAKELFEKAVLAIRDGLYSETDSEDIKEVNGIYYAKTKLKYSELKEKYEEIFTEEALENVLEMNAIDVEGIAYAVPKAGPGYSIENITVEKVNDNNKELTYKAIYTKTFTDSSVKEESTCQFKIKKINGNYRIFATNYLNLDKEEGLDNSKELNSEEIKKIIQGYLNILGAKRGSPASALMTDEIKLISSYSEIEGKVDNNNYISSKIKYSDFKNKMLEYMTEELFGKISDPDYKNVNGMLYIADIGASGISFKIEEIELISEEDDKCKYRIKGLEFEPGQEYDFIGEVELQKNKENKYVVSKFEWELEENEKSEANDYNNTNINANNSTTNIKNNNATILGDVNCDGVINGKDLVAMRKYVDNNEQNLTEQGKKNADVNDDGNITEGDVEVLRLYLVGTYKTLPQKNNSTLCGDVNCDGVVNGKDLVGLRKYVDNNEQNLTEQGIRNADVNDDDAVNQADVNILRKYLAGTYNRLPQRISGEELASKAVPGMTIKYPENWIITEIDKETWGNRTGNATCIFKGTINNTVVTVTTYDPLFEVGGYKNLIKKECSKYGIAYFDGLEENGYNIGSNSDSNLEWRVLGISSNIRNYYHIIDENVDNALKVEVKIDNPAGENQLPVERVIDDIILGTTVRSY